MNRRGGGPRIAGALVMALGVLASAGARCDEIPGAALEAETRGTLFSPLMADPKEPHFFASVLGTHLDSTNDSVTLGSVGFGDEFGFLGRQGARSGWQVGLQAGVMAQFVLERGSTYPLINADYVVGLPVTWRRDRVSARLRVYHQSSHLGDEYLLQNPDVRRIDVSFEELEGIAALDIGGGRGRAYVGAGALLHRNPDMERGKLLAGLEWRGWGHPGSGGARGLGRRLVAGVEVKLLQELDWEADVRAVLGVKLTPELRGRSVSLLAEYYHGSIPYGQFFHEKEDHIGLGLHLGL